MYFHIIDGHGVGVWGCAHPPKNLKSPNTPPCRRHGGCAPQCQRPGRKKIFDTPVGLFFVIFFAKSHPCLLIKPPRRKKILTPRWKKKFRPPKAAAKFFLDTPLCTHPPCPKTRAHLCVQLCMNLYEYIGVISSNQG